MSSATPDSLNVPADLIELAVTLFSRDLVIADFVGILARDSFSRFVGRSFSDFCFASSVLDDALSILGLNEELLMMKNVATRQPKISTRRTRPTACSFLTSQNE